MAQIRIKTNGTIYTVRNNTLSNVHFVSLYNGSSLENVWTLESDCVPMKPMNKYEALENFLHTDLCKALVKGEHWETLSKCMLYFFKESDCGKYGKIFEIIIKLYLNGYRGNSCIVSPKGKVDVTYKGKRIEVKSNCGELDDIRKSEYVVYTMDNEAEVNTPQYARVLPVDSFMYVLESINLIRTKTNKGYVKTTIQSYKNSKKRSALFENLLVTASQPLENWKRA